MTVLARLLVLIVLITLLGGMPTAQAGVGDGRRLLIGTGDLVDGGGILKSRIPVLADEGSRFSPDGSMLAYRATASRVGIQHADGSTELLADIPNFGIRSIAWDPDMEQLAVLGRWFEPGNQEARIYLVPLDGSAPVRVFDDTLTVRLSEFGGISWRSTDDTLAVTATTFFEYEPGRYAAQDIDTDLVWTMPAQSNATPTRYSGQSVRCEGCEAASGFRSPAWSPDGSRLAVQDSDADGAWVGYLEPGDSSASRLAVAQGDGSIGWSADGEELAFTIPDVDGDAATNGIYPDTRVVDADTGATLTTIRDHPEQFVDRLPCPGGTCPVWEDVYVAPRPTMDLKGRARKGKVVASGSMGAVPVVSFLDLTLSRKARAGARWRRVTTVEVRATEGMFKKSLPRPRGVQCRFTGVYEGADGQRASDTATFAC